MGREVLGVLGVRVVLEVHVVQVGQGVNWSQGVQEDRVFREGQGNLDDRVVRDGFGYMCCNWNIPHIYYWSD